MNDEVFFFSATGNSLYVAGKFSERARSIPQEMRKAVRNYRAYSIGIVCPVYYGEIPGYVQNFLKTSSFSTPYFYCILTYGSSPMIAPKFAFEYAKKCGISVNYATCILMVDNYLPYFDMNVEMSLDKHVESQIAKALEEVQDRKTGIPAPTDEEKEWYDRVRRFNVENPAFNSGSQICITDKCVGCGVCARVCPQGNCCLESGKAHRKKETCEFCMACIQNCPVNAIALTMEDKNPDARYRNTHVSLKQLEAANCQFCATEKS